MRIHMWEMTTFREAVRDLLRFVSTASSWRRYSDMLDKNCRRRAIELLVQNLSPSQREQYERLSHFDVIGGDTGRRYRIRYGDQMNVELLDQNGRRMRVLCFTPEGHLPVGDIMLAQKIALELFESKAIAVANKLPPRRYVVEEEDLRLLRRFHRSVT